jgi:glycosyltransferase involved in cell wall biosynthesis
MHIVILHYAAPPVVGGVERVIYYHATLLAEAGYEVSVVAGRGEPFDPGVAFHRLDVVGSRHPDILALKAELDQGRVPEGFDAMRDHILDALRPLLDGADVLIAHNVLGLHKNLPLTAALRQLVEEQSSPRLIAWHHDLAWKASRYLPELYDGDPWNLLRQPWPHTRHVAVSQARRQDVAELFQVSPDEVTVVPGGVDILSFLGLAPAIRQFVDEVGLEDTLPWLLLPARITRRKNIELAVRVTAALQKGDFPNIALIVTGPPGPHNPDNLGYFGELKRLRDELALDGAVHFLSEELGESPTDDQMVTLYHLADALMLPSYEEGFGIPIIEAALTRLPIFCSDIAPLRELAGGRANYFSPHAEPEQIAQLISRVLAADRAIMLRRRVLNRYGWRRIVHKQVEPLLAEK